VSYRRWAEPREVRRTLDPHGLVVKNGAWYLVAADRTRATTPPLRTYRVSNILDLRIEDVTFERVASFDLAEFWQHHLADFDRRRITATAHLRVAPELVARLPDLSDSGLADAVRRGSHDERGWVLAELPIESAAKGAVQLIGYGSDIQVVSPPELRTALVDLADAVLRQYAPD
jgi:predicted DNA-binding transcriptional regulator YafY